MPRYQWIVFDSTGTLMTPDPEPAQVYRDAAARFADPGSIDEVRTRLKAALRRHFFGETATAPTSEAFELQRWRQIVADTLGGGIPRNDFQSAFEALWQHFADAAAWRLFADVTDTLQRLRRQGYSIAVASNFDGRLRPILAGLGLEALVDEVLISSDLGFSKPNPQFYTAAAERLGAGDCRRLLMIGDTYEGDVAAARQSGWDARHLVRDRPDALAELTSDL